MEANGIRSAIFVLEAGRGGIPAYRCKVMCASLHPRPGGQEGHSLISIPRRPNNKPSGHERKRRVKIRAAKKAKHRGMGPRKEGLATRKAEHRSQKAEKETRPRADQRATRAAKARAERAKERTARVRAKDPKVVKAKNKKARAESNAFLAHSSWNSKALTDPLNAGKLTYPLDAFSFTFLLVNVESYGPPAVCRLTLRRYLFCPLIESVLT